MNKEEAIRRIEFCRDFLANNYSDIGEPNFMALNMAIEALKQKSNFDKMKMEIKALPRYGSKSNRFLTVYVDVYEALKIIDKHKAESEEA